MADNHNTPDHDLPDPRPPRQHPPIMELSFAALGWLNRAAQAVGSVRFTESIQRSRFNLERAKRHARTPAELAVIAGLASSLQGLIRADADARELLAASLSDLDAALDEGGLHAESADGADDSESQGHDISQDPAA
ncbi:MAG: hypothetical protein WCI78_11530 [Mycobacterium sp.]